MKIAPQDIVLFHVGGSMGSYGPIDAIINKFPHNCVVVGFEARQDEGDQDVDSKLSPMGVRLHLVNAFIGEEDGKIQKFYINKHPESSSGLPPNPEVFDEICPVPYFDESPTWGVNTALDRKVEFRTKSLRTAIAEFGAAPDVLSIDAQGSEYAILKGSSDSLKDVVALVTEVEFFEIYSGQGLYSDQAALLGDIGFRLADLLNSQSWYPRVQCGKGLLTMAEALWFRRLNSFFLGSGRDAEFILKGIKFAAIAYSLEYYSIAYLLMEKLRSICASDLESYCREFGYAVLLDVYSQVKDLEDAAKQRWNK